MKSILQTPGKIGALTVKNRIVMEALGNALSNLDGSVSREDIDFYAERAKGGVGLIMSEAVSVDSVTGRANPRNLCIDRDDLIPGYQALVDAVHEDGCAFFVELYHPGRQGDSALNGGRHMYAPSNIPCGLTHQPVTEMTREEISCMVMKFIEGAVRCQKAGVDGVLLHAAHGYLLNQFLSPYTNHRTDQYGGCAENRARFTLEIIHGIRDACGKDYPIGVRLTACEYLDYIGLPRDLGITPELAREYAILFQEAGADLLDVSSGIYETMNTAWEPVGFSQGWKTELARELKKCVDIPVVCTSLIRDPAYAVQLLEEGVCDFVGSARAHLADSHWANKAMEGRGEDIRPCISCLNCMKTLAEGEVRCAVNPQAAHESNRCELRKNGDGRLVVVVGGGIAGMEAAHVAALRGFRVVLLEKASRLGGTLWQATAPPHKERIGAYLRYMEREMVRLGVEIRLDTEATPEEIAVWKPYRVFLAVGAIPVMPAKISGADRAYTSADILTGRTVLTNKNVVVIGGGMVGLETAEYLHKYGNAVSLYEMRDELAEGEHFQNIIDIAHRLGDIPTHTGCRLTEIREDVCVFHCKDETELTVPYQAVVLALGMKPNKAAAEKYTDALPCKMIGTCVSYGNIATAVHSAFTAIYEME